MTSTRTRSFGLGVVAALATLLLGTGGVHAADNDIVLTRFATFEEGKAVKNEELFESFVEDFGQVMAPNFAAPSSTLGQAGFSVNLVPSVRFIDDGAEHWQQGVEDRDPPGAMFVPALEVRKGLPFSFEVAGTMSHIGGSDMFTVGSQVKWAIHEGFRVFPDVAVRGMVNTMVGGEQLEMITAGWDVSVGYGFPIAGIVEVSPYAGFQRLNIWGWSRLLNVRPQDPRAPTEDFNPEFVFDTKNIAVNRVFFGSRLDVVSVDLLLEGALGENVQQFTASVGMSF